MENIWFCCRDHPECCVAEIMTFYVWAHYDSRYRFSFREQNETPQTWQREYHCTWTIPHLTWAEHPGDWEPFQNRISGCHPGKTLCTLAILALSPILRQTINANVPLLTVYHCGKVHNGRLAQRKALSWWSFSTISLPPHYVETNDYLCFLILWGQGTNSHF